MLYNSRDNFAPPGGYPIHRMPGGIKNDCPGIPSSVVNALAPFAGTFRELSRALVGRSGAESAISDAFDILRQIGTGCAGTDRARLCKQRDGLAVGFKLMSSASSLAGIAGVAGGLAGVFGAGAAIAGLGIVLAPFFAIAAASTLLFGAVLAVMNEACDKGQISGNAAADAVDAVAKFAKVDDNVAPFTQFARTIFGSAAFKIKFEQEDSKMADAPTGPEQGPATQAEQPAQLRDIFVLKLRAALRRRVDVTEIGDLLSNVLFPTENAPKFFQAWDARFPPGLDKAALQRAKAEAKARQLKIANFVVACRVVLTKNPAATAEQIADLAFSKFFFQLPPLVSADGGSGSSGVVAAGLGIPAALAAAYFFLR